MQRGSTVARRNSSQTWHKSRLPRSTTIDEAERAAPNLTLVDVQMIGAAGRLYISGATADVTTARDRITTVLAGIEGRDH